MEIRPSGECPDTPEKLLKQLPSSAGSPVDKPVRDATKAHTTVLCLSGVPHLMLKGILPLWNYSKASCHSGIRAQTLPGKVFQVSTVGNFYFFLFKTHEV